MRKRFEELADGWSLNYAETMERLIMQAEKRGQRKYEKNNNGTA